jgi:hypothetical protein
MYGYNREINASTLVSHEIIALPKVIMAYDGILQPELVKML